ncbi:Uu.00g087650.m01.CDS01 [Anthostomella pinea]|uniref:Uu.00g087650.m01.CDS01 n=1 Tax=Anthostomella pinea TaxID=933095 RepID=A0AAI8VME3_9PEZI|nr:Uu.00g087650.m01.CDS01 [Anthostomella pinea]
MSPQRPRQHGSQTAVTPSFSQPGENGTRSMSFSASRVSSNRLKEYLDSNYPGQYSVKLKRNEFTVNIQGKSSRNT